jgi:flavin-dependent dehydrogenase
MHTTQSQEYDVVIMGAGFAGNCQARHLLLKIPGIKIAIIDPRPEERTEKDLKIGESTVEVSAMFLYRELGLHEYLIENHAPKYGLNFLWPKDLAKTDSLDDYYHLWTEDNPPLPSFQLNRAKLEQDLLEMNQETGAVFYNGRVVDVDLTSAKSLHTVKVKVGKTEIDLKAKHVIDAAGRRFIIGRKTDNLIFEPENLCGVNTGSAWVRVKNVDRDLFDEGYHPTGGVTSHYYCTNHYLGYGHWLWMIPIETQSRDLSIGVVHHNEVIPAKQINTLDKFSQFLEKNHHCLYRLIQSGEVVDFNYLPRLAHTSKQMLSEDNWYVIGDAAAIFDAFYSTGLVMTSITIETVTEVIRAKLAGDADADDKRAAYNEYNLANVQFYNQLVSQHTKQLGHASIMSWRIYFEYMLWFGIAVPMYLGKWHLDPEYAGGYSQAVQPLLRLMARIYDQLDRLVERGTNLGMMDFGFIGQLSGSYLPSQAFDGFLAHGQFEPQRSNVFASTKYTYYYMALWYAKLQWKGFGVLSLLTPRCLWTCLQLLGLAGAAAIDEWRYKSNLKELPASGRIAQMRQEFKHYQYCAELQPWGEATHANPVEPAQDIKKSKLVLR